MNNNFLMGLIRCQINIIEYRRKDFMFGFRANDNMAKKKEYQNLII